MWVCQKCVPQAASHSCRYLTYYGTAGTVAQVSLSLKLPFCSTKTRTLTYLPQLLH